MYVFSITARIQCH